MVREKIEMTIRHEYDPEPPNFVEIEHYIVDLNAIDAIHLYDDDGEDLVIIHLSSGRWIDLKATGHDDIRKILRERGRLE